MYLSSCHMAWIFLLLNLCQLSKLWPLPGPCHPPAPNREGDVGETALMLCEHCSAGAKGLECYRHLSNSQWGAQHCQGCCGEHELHLSQTQYTHKSWLAPGASSSLYFRHTYQPLSPTLVYWDGTQSLPVQANATTQTGGE